MAFLRLLGQLRNPVLDAFFSAVTYFGDEICFMLIAIVFLWCVNKKDAYYVLLTCFFGTICCQFLKLAFRIPRPWVLDPDFMIVESARAAATGYSFPSGHTLNSVATALCLLLTQKKKGIRIAAVALMVLVPFSRMYLGVHTPADVLVAFALAAASAFLMRFALARAEKHRHGMAVLLGSLLVISAAYLLYVTYYPFPADIDPENLAEGVKNAYVLLGCLLGMLAAIAFERRFVNYSERAVWWAQVLKVVLGVVVVLAVRMLLKAPLRAVLPDGIADLLRYGLMVFAAGALYPLSFRTFGRLGQKS